MVRTIVALGRDASQATVVSLKKAGFNDPQAAVPVPFPLRRAALPPWGTPDAVRIHGEAIRQNLARHAQVQRALNEARAAPNGDVRPIFFEIGADEAEDLCLETIFENNAFYALDRRWPIARMADQSGTDETPLRELNDPVRLLIVLSAIGVSGAQEWRALYSAVVNARGRGLPIQVVAVVGEPALYDAIDASIQQGQLQGVRVHPVPRTLPEFENLVDEFAPNLVHFFCHGRVAQGDARLEVATLLDWEQGAPGGSLRIPMEALANHPSLRRDAWLVLLNCCQSGMPSADLPSMARQLVSSGIPAAVGVLEALDAGDATEFTKGFYQGTFARLVDAFRNTAVGATAPFDWALALYAPRVALTNRYQGDARNHHQWALPVLYVRPETFRFLRTAPKPGTQAEREADLHVLVESVAGFLRELPPTTPMEIRREVLGSLARVPVDQRPDAFGQFGLGT